MNRKWISLVGCITFSVGVFFACNAMAVAQTKPSPRSPARIDLSKATVDQLTKTAGLTPALAKAIVAYREGTGPFKRPEDLLMVKGITKGLLNRLNAKMEGGVLSITPLPRDDEEEPSLGPTKC